KRLRTDTLQVERSNLLNPDKAKEKSFLQATLEKEEGVFIASSDNMRLVSDQIAYWVQGGLYSLGTDGHGLSENRDELIEYFEVNYKYQVLAALTQLVNKGQADKSLLSKAIKDLGINSGKRDPLYKI